MNSKQMDYVIELAQTLNFNRAADKLFISQPALSYQIKSLEEELAFKIFDRMGKSVRLTPAGKQFVQNIRQIRLNLQESIEQGQNFSSRYSDNLTISYPLRSCLYFLPEAIQDFAELNPQVLISPDIGNSDAITAFNEGQTDLLFISRHDASTIPDSVIHPLYQSKIYLLVNPHDPLAQKEKASPADLVGRTLLVNGGSSLKLRKVQEEVLSQVKLDTLNSPSHDFTMVAVAANRAVCLSPGYLNDFSDEFTWLPFETEETFDCVLVSHSSDKRQSLADFILLLQDIYQEKALSYAF